LKNKMKMPVLVWLIMPLWLHYGDTAHTHTHTHTNTHTHADAHTCAHTRAHTRRPGYLRNGRLVLRLEAGQVRERV